MGIAPCIGEGNQTMKIFGKQSVAVAFTRALPVFLYASGCFGVRPGNIR
jgi:hypothetical protein